MCLHFLVFVIFFLATFHDARKQNVVNKEEEVVRSILWKLLNPKEKFPFCWRKQYQSEDLKVWRCQGGLLFSILDFVGRIYVCLDFLHFPFNVYSPIVQFYFTNLFFLAQHLEIKVITHIKYKSGKTSVLWSLELKLCHKIGSKG